MREPSGVGGLEEPVEYGESGDELDAELALLQSMELMTGGPEAEEALYARIFGTEPS